MIAICFLPFDHEEKFDYEKIQNIVAALEYLRTEAHQTGSEEIYTLINSAFNICFTLYYIFLRAGHTLSNET